MGSPVMGTFLISFMRRFGAGRRWHEMRNVPITFFIWLIPTIASAAPFTFIVAGLGGEPEYEQRFREQAAAIAEAAEKAAGAPGHVIVLTGEQARRDAVRSEFATFAGKVKATDSATVVLIGHGTYDGEEYRFNLPGTDITGSELSQLFDKLAA